MGALIIAPVLLTLLGWSKVHRKWNIIEMAALFFSLTVVSITLLASDSIVASPQFAQKYILVLFMVWAALRFDQRITSIAVLIISCVAIWGVVHEIGPFTIGTTNERLMVALSFISILSLTALSMGATTAERKRAELSLRQSEEEFRAIFELAAVGKCQVDPFTGLFVRVNNKLCEMVGYSAEELQKMTLLELTHPDDRIGDERRLENMRNGDTASYSFEKRYIRKDGKIIWGQVDAVMVRGSVGHPWTSIAVIQDISERKRAEEALRASEARKAAILESALDCIITMDHFGNIVEFNPAAEKTFGFSRERVIGKPLADIVVPPALRERHRQGLAQHFATGRDTVLGKLLELPAIRADGSEFPAELSIVKVRTDGPPVFTGFIRDITERKQSHEELVRAKESADAANRIKDEFLAVVSHELRTPLTAMLGWIRMIRRAVLSPTQLQQGLAVIDRNISVQTQLVDDLLDVSRIISGKLVVNRRPLNLREVVLAAVQSVQHAADAKQIDLRLHIDSVPTTGDPDRLQQIAWNLISNAIKFTQKSGTIDVSLQIVKSDAVLTVSDNGIGISPEIQPFLFEAFRQADSSTTRQFGGLGLGLAIVRHLVELHGGQVCVQSGGMGKGATLIVRLPIPVTQAVKESIPSFEPNQTQLKDMEILAVDDEPDARELIKIVLELAGAHVVTASSAAEAIEQLKRIQPDLLICDIGMPNKDGYTFIRELRSLPDKVARTPAMALSAYSKAEDRQRASAAGFDRYLPKPVEPTELVREVARCRSAG